MVTLISMLLIETWRQLRQAVTQLTNLTRLRGLLT